MNSYYYIMNGAKKSQHVEKNVAKLNALNEFLEILPFDKQAAIAYERMARIGADKVNALIRLAQLSVERSRYQDARHYLEEAQSLKPQTYVADYLEQVKRLVR